MCRIISPLIRLGDTQTVTPCLGSRPSDAEDLAVKFKEHNAPCLQRTLTASRLGLSHLSSPSHTQSWRHNIWIQFITRNGPSQLNTKITFRCEGLLLHANSYYTLIKNMMFYFFFNPFEQIDYKVGMESNCGRGKTGDLTSDKKETEGPTKYLQSYIMLMYLMATMETEVEIFVYGSST